MSLATLTPIEVLIHVALEAIETRPVADRPTIYRAIAAVANDETVAIRAAGIADELDRIEKSHRQLVLDFRNGGQS